MSRDFPVSPEEFETGFVERIFGVPSGSLQSLTHEPVGTGQVCDSYRFHCEWIEGTGETSGLSMDIEAPATFVTKCPSANEISRNAAAVFHLYDMEVGWYRDVSAKSGVDCPLCFHAEIADNGREFVLMLQDMTPATQGDQLTGASLIQVESTLEEAAALHSIPRSHVDFDRLPWLHHFEGNGEFTKNTVINGYEAFRDRFSNLLSSDVLDLGQELVNRMDRYTEREPLEQTITHGDMRLDNILFHADGRLAALVDWQTCSLGNPANDVAYMIGTSFADPAERRAHEQRLVQDYLDQRAANTNAVPDFDSFWEEYRRHAFSGFVMAINASLHVEQTERGDAMFAAMAERPAQMAMDLDSLSLI